MVREGVERRLTTILAADVVGYSRLMAADEAGSQASSATNVRVGSNCDLRHRLALRLECDGEPTFGPERRLCGGDRT